VVVRSSGDQEGSKSVSGVAARIFDLEEDVHLLVSVSGEPSTGGVLCNWHTATEEDGAAVILEDNDGFGEIEGMDGCKGESAAGCTLFRGAPQRHSGAWSLGGISSEDGSCWQGREEQGRVRCVLGDPREGRIEDLQVHMPDRKRGG
jgi:hypothetical protein